MRRDKSPGYTIRCDNLPTNIDSLLLRKAFKDFGRIEYCRVVENDYGESKGYGFVDFESKDSAISSAKRMDRAKFNGREVRVTIR
jgi:RNA recognition motif-containing protein